LHALADQHLRDARQEVTCERYTERQIADACIFAGMTMLQCGDVLNALHELQPAFTLGI
jgi:hypothetical protein